MNNIIKSIDFILCYYDSFIECKKHKRCDECEFEYYKKKCIKNISSILNNKYFLSNAKTKHYFVSKIGIYESNSDANSYTLLLSFEDIRKLKNIKKL